MSGPLESELRAVDRGEGIASVEKLAGGVVNDVWLVRYTDGARVVAKTLGDAPPDLFRLEAAGLEALRSTQTVQVPEVLAVTERVLLLEPLAPRSDRTNAWEAFAHDLADLYRGTVHDRFGWHEDGYLGRLRQHNSWTEDGHAFFAEHRLLRYLGEPSVEGALEPADRRALERLCSRLPEIVPPMPPVLTHGDLWANNLLSAGDRLAVVDPAVAYTWAEADLAMLYCCAPPPAAGPFFARYQELNPSPAGWEERMPLLFLREVLSQIAHSHNMSAAVDRLRRTLAPFYVRTAGSG